MKCWCAPPKNVTLAVEYEALPIITDNRGTMITLGEIANVRDTFEETDIEATYNGEKAVRIDVFRVGDETPTDVSEAVNGYVKEANASLPSTVRLSIWEDRSELLGSRIELLG